MPKSFQPKCILAACFVAVLHGLAAVANAQLDPDTYNALIDGWQAAVDAGQYREAEQIALQIKANDERYYPGKTFWKTALASAYFGQGRYRDALPLYKQELETIRRSGAQGETLVEALMNLGAAYLQMGEYDKAEPVLKEGIAVANRALGRDHESTLNCVNNLALVHLNRGALKEAATLFNEIIQAHHRTNNQSPMRVGAILNLVDVYVRQGRFQKAEELSRYGLKTVGTIGMGLEHPTTLRLVQNYAGVLIQQNRSAEVQSMLEDAVARAKKTMGADHPDYASMLTTLAACYTDLGMEEKSSAATAQAIKILERQFGPTHQKLLAAKNRLAWDLIRANKFATAEKLLRDALPETKGAPKTTQMEVSIARINLAEALVWQAKFDEAEKLLTQALADLELNSAALEHQHNAWRNLARIDWERGEKQRAIERMGRALEFAEQTRQFSSGAEFERAASFGWFSYSYELMVGWQFELGDYDGCFTTMERSRAKAYLEAINHRGVDLFEGLPAAERTKLENQRAELRGRLSTLWADYEQLPEAADSEAKETAERREKLITQLRDTREELYQFESDLRAKSKVYQRLLATEAGKVSVADARRELLTDDALLVSYFIGSYRSFVVAVSADDIRMIELVAQPDEARQLGIEPGPLTREKLHTALQADAAKAVLPMLTKRDDSKELHDRLHALWKALVPADLAADFTNDQRSRLILLPDGPAALLPFETLIVEPAAEPVYLLDKCPPISYAPSTAIMLKLAERPHREAKEVGVLTLGNPLYDRSQIATAQTASRTTRSQATRFRAGLKPLPASGVEAEWVAQVYQKAGAKVTKLIGAAATESAVRSNLGGKQVVHLACHGMSENSFGNFYGMLAVAPGGKPGDAADDGMLTSTEIDELDLSACELAILSACLTNHGPEQQGEGIWALSRAFIVSGARRVMASNWVIDDNAGASLVSAMCTDLSQQSGEGDSVEHARALRDAKRWVRGQAKWSHPFYWGPLVLVGPN